jgi:dihydrodipicolinate synthase/N-acetylneuraminate lyase
MKHEDQRLGFINSTMNIVNDLCADIYEAMVDEDYDDALGATLELLAVLQDLNQTLSDEI